VTLRGAIIFFLAIRGQNTTVCHGLRYTFERGLPQQSEIQHQTFYIDSPTVLFVIYFRRGMHLTGVCIWVISVICNTISWHHLPYTCLYSIISFPKIPPLVSILYEYLNCSESARVRKQGKHVLASPKYCVNVCTLSQAVQGSAKLMRVLFACAKILPCRHRI
jgi:hypothetical protein